MAGGEAAVAAKKKPSSKRPASSRTKDSDGGKERRSSDEHKTRRDSGGRSQERSDSEEEEEEGLQQKAGSNSKTRQTGDRASSRSPSPMRARKTKVGNGASESNNRHRNHRSKSPNKQASTAPKKPARMGSGVSAASASLDKAFASGLGGKKPKQDAEEESLGEFAKYQGKLGAGLLGAFHANQNSFVPEESLGSFTGFIKRYEQEELLGLHDKPGAYNPYEQQLKKPKQQLQQFQKPDASMGDIMNPMKQYGGPGARQAPADAEDSLGSFTQFATKYEKDKLLGLQDSELSEPPVQEDPDIPEESMDVLELLGGETEAEDEPCKKEKKGLDDSYYDQDIDIDVGEADIDVSEIVRKVSDEESDTEDYKKDEFPKIEVPPSRIENLTKQGNVRYKIMVDTPGGHSPEPMKIVVAIEFEDDSDSEGENEKEDPYEAVARLSHQDLYERKQGSNYFDHHPDEDSGDDQSEEEENERANFLPRQIGGWNQSHSENDGGLGIVSSQHSSSSRNASGAPPHLPEHHTTHSTSTHSTLSSLTLESNVQIQTDACPSNQNAIQRQPARRPSGPPGVIAPHNLGTRRGLMLRQMSEASMKSAISNDSSWVDPSDVPEDYQASFMQLNLLDLNKTQMQTNEEAEQAILPDTLPCGMEHIPEDAEEEELEGAIPDGKEPQVASQELLGMKTMLKHIKRAAPKRSRSFDFDRETPKAMWNSLFARSQKNELPGSQYVDNDDSSERDEDHANENAGGNQAREGEQAPEGDEGARDAPQAKKSGFLSTIKRVTSKPKDKDKEAPERSASKGKSSLWSSMAIKTVIRPKEKSQEQECDDDEASCESHREEEEHIGENQDYEDHDDNGYEHDEEGEVKEDEHSDYESDHSEGRRRRRHRRKGAGDKGENSTRSAGRASLKEHRSQRRAGPARNRAKTNTSMHNQSLSGALDFYTAEQEESEEEGEMQEVTEPLEPVKEDDDEQPKRKGRPRRKLPGRTKSDVGGPTTTRNMPSRTRSSDGLRGMPNRTKSTPTDSSPTRPPRTKSGLDEKNVPTARPKPKSMPRRTKSTPEGKERGRSHDKGVSVKHRVDKVRPLKLSKPPVNPHPENSGHSRALQLPEDATEEQLRDLLDYH